MKIGGYQRHLLEQLEMYYKEFGTEEAIMNLIEHPLHRYFDKAPSEDTLRYRLKLIRQAHEDLTNLEPGRGIKTFEQLEEIRKAAERNDDTWGFYHHHLDKRRILKAKVLVWSELTNMSGHRFDEDYQTFPHGSKHYCDHCFKQQWKELNEKCKIVDRALNDAYGVLHQSLQSGPGYTFLMYLVVEDDFDIDEALLVIELGEDIRSWYDIEWKRLHEKQDAERAEREEDETLHG